MSFLPDYLCGTVKEGGGSLLGWPTFLLEEQVPFTRSKAIRTSTSTMRSWCCILRKITSKHTAKSVGRWFGENLIRVLSWSSQLPDLNPIEISWTEVDVVKIASSSYHSGTAGNGVEGSLGCYPLAEAYQTSDLHAPSLYSCHPEQGPPYKILINVSNCLQVKLVLQRLRLNFWMPLYIPIYCMYICFDCGKI